MDVNFNLKFENCDDELLSLFSKIETNINNNDNICYLRKNLLITKEMIEVAKSLKNSRDLMNTIRNYKSRIVDEKGILGEIIFEKFLFETRIKNLDKLKDLDKYYNNNILNYSNIETDWINQACLNNSKDYDFLLDNTLTNKKIKIEIKTITDKKDININSYSFSQSQNLIDCYVIIMLKETNFFIQEINENINVFVGDIVLLNKNFFANNCKNINADKERKITEHKRLEYKKYSQYLV